MLFLSHCVLNYRILHWRSSFSYFRLFSLFSKHVYPFLLLLLLFSFPFTRLPCVLCLSCTNDMYWWRRESWSILKCSWAAVQHGDRDAEGPLWDKVDVISLINLPIRLTHRSLWADKSPVTTVFVCVHCKWQSSLTTTLKRPRSSFIKGCSEENVNM